MKWIDRPTFNSLRSASARIFWNALNAIVSNYYLLDLIVIWLSTGQFLISQSCLPHWFSLKAINQILICHRSKQRTQWSQLNCRQVKPHGLKLLYVTKQVSSHNPLIVCHSSRLLNISNWKIKWMWAWRGKNGIVYGIP